jgi:hypothetical protein
VSWFVIRNQSGDVVRRIFALTAEDLAVNVPDGCTVDDDATPPPVVPLGPASAA